MKNMDWKTILEENPEFAEHFEKVEFRKMGERTTVYLVTLKNGYEITGYSAVWDLSLYDKDKGRYWAFRRAVEKFPALKEKGYVG